MNATFSELSLDVLAALRQAPNKRLQRRQIQTALSEKYRKKYATNNIFNVTLQRTLNRLVKAKLLEKDDKGHKQVYYYIPRKCQKQIAEILEWQGANKLFNDYWSVLTPQQRKQFAKETEALLNAALRLLVKNKVHKLMNQGREYVTVAELREPLKEVLREKTRPKVGDIFNERPKAWRLFLEKHDLTPKTFNQIKDGKRQMQILREFEEYWSKEYWKEESKSL